MLNLAEADLTDLALAKKLSQVPEKSILLLEDVDAAFASRTESQDQVISNSQVPHRLDPGIAWYCRKFVINIQFLYKYKYPSKKYL